MFANKEEFIEKFNDRFFSLNGKALKEGTLQEKYLTLTSLIKDILGKNWADTNRLYENNKVKKVYYFCIEYLPGRSLLNNLINLELDERVSEYLNDIGISLKELYDLEQDPGLGNGGLGRLAAAFLDSMAALGIPGIGVGIRYKYGLFEQKIMDGNQIELPDNWLNTDYPWEYKRPEEAVEIRFAGNVLIEEKDKKLLFKHENYLPVKAVPFDIPIIGYRNNVVNTLRLWSTEPFGQGFDLTLFNSGKYLESVKDIIQAETISRVLYPYDNNLEGKILRLKQQYFFVSAGLQDIVRNCKKVGFKTQDLYKYAAIHINDTHPALVVPELMRILIDEENIDWEEAWSITTQTVSYTNHTTLPEALEKWHLDLIKHFLPRIFMIIEEINRRFCAELLEKYPYDPERIREMAVVADGHVNMANLAILGSHSINGVAQLHTEILKKRVMNSFYEYDPYKFNNKTNGITQRRWLLIANPALAELINSRIGTAWITNPQKLSDLLPYREDQSFLEEFARAKLLNKMRLARFIKDKYEIDVDPHSIYDAHIKRIHAYKRQLLNTLHIMYLYNNLRENTNLDFTPRTFIFAGKAAPGYDLAKRIIKLINYLVKKINSDRLVKDKLKVVFLENYNVTLGELIFPAADVSQQISTASKEASGTGNMKFMMNGAVTLGTLDGANIEIREMVGAENFFAFGLTAEEIMNYYQEGGYSAWDHYNQDIRLKTVCEQLINGFFSGAKDEFRAIYDHLLTYNDEYFVLKDFDSYAAAQKNLESAFNNRQKWLKMCATNTAQSGIFSSDRTIKEYADEIWGDYALCTTKK